jgi:hypothetical protein
VVVRRAGAYGERAGQRENLAALLKGDIEKAAELRAHLVKPEARELAAEYLRAATAVALEYRFGPGAGMGAGPVDYDELTAFMGEVRPPSMLSRRRTSLRWKRSCAHSTGSRTCSNPSAPSSAVRRATRPCATSSPATGGSRSTLAITIDRAKYLMMIWMGWPRASSDRLSRTDTQTRPCARRGRALIMSAD